MNIHSSKERREGNALGGVNEGVDTGVGARAVVGERRVAVAGEVREVAEHGAVAGSRVRAEPGRVARGGRGVGRQVPITRRTVISASVTDVCRNRCSRLRVGGVGQGVGRSGGERGLLGSRAANVGLALGELGPAGNGEPARDGSDMRLSVRADLDGLAGGRVDEVEEVRRLDGVRAGTGGGEVVRGRDYVRHQHMQD